MEIEQTIQQKIEALELEIEGLKQALVTIQRSKARQGSPSMRFFGMRPLKAIQILLEENKSRMKRQQLAELLMAGGIAVGRKRGGHNVRISIDLNVANGNLVADGDWIDLPGRATKKQSR